jgi:hypothetical protein
MKTDMEGCTLLWITQNFQTPSMRFSIFCLEFHMGEKILYGIPEGNRQIRRPRSRWEDPVAGCCERGNETSDSIKGQ